MDTMLTPDAQDRHAARVGVAYGVAAYGTWGLAPIYFHAVRHISAEQVLAHRVIWAVTLLWPLVLLLGRWRALISAITHRTTMVTLLASTALIAFNWYLFIWAVANGRVLYASLGYFINPLLSVLLGMVFLRERLRPVQVFSVLLAAAGVGWRTVMLGELPAVALALAGSFGFYGLLRKVARVDAITGLTFETSLLFPAALGYAIYLGRIGTGAFAAGDLSDTLLLMAAGLVTSVPLLCFTAAARRLRLATLGFLQYLAPTGQFLLAVWAFGEPLRRGDLTCFVLIWIALSIYSVDAARSAARSRR